MKYMLLLTFFLAGFIFLRKKYPKIQGWNIYNPPSSFIDNKEGILLETFRNQNHSLLKRYENLFHYFLLGILEFKTDRNANVFYPGHKGIRGHKIEGLEGFARSMPLLAAWISSDRPTTVNDPRNPNQSIDITEIIRSGIVAGTDPDTEEFWGNATDLDQRIVEASDISLIIWLTKDQIWDHLSADEQNKISTWLQNTSEKAVSPNNWLLFRVLIIEVLAALGQPCNKTASQSAYQEFKKDYLEAGWFFDKPKGVDFYNTWAIGYSLYWINRINPDFDSEFIINTLTASAQTTLHLISPEGIPLLGRSASYRMAVPSAVITGYLSDPQVIKAGQAARALDLVWQYYDRKGGIKQGKVTQGIYGDDMRFMERYSGTGSSLWSLRSLVMAFSIPRDDSFWHGPTHLLPVEIDDYSIAYPKLGWEVNGDKNTGEIRIYIKKNQNNPSFTPHRYRWIHKLVEKFFSRPFQPNNDAVKYQRPFYSSKLPYGITNSHSQSLRVWRRLTSLRKLSDEKPTFPRSP